ncbi:hypothetical protein N6H14_31655 [Paenibacillus sp. CC-CFT747]|nr:hypothetical protein N6H14_31655 [Paenibacillus sp. CC-CFT747]
MLETQGDQTEIDAWNEIVRSYQEAHAGTRIKLQTMFFPGWSSTAPGSRPS